MIKEERVGISVLGDNEVEGFFIYGEYEKEEFLQGIKEQFDIELPTDVTVKYGRARVIEYYNRTRKAIMVDDLFPLETSMRITYVELEPEKDV